MATARYIRKKSYGEVSGAEEVSSGDDYLYLGREVYKELGNLTKNRTIEVPSEVLTKYDRFITDINDWTLGTAEATDEMLAIDEYLGSLGVDLEYPFSADIPEVVMWLDYLTTSKTRYVINGEDMVVNGNTNVVLTRN